MKTRQLAVGELANWGIEASDHAEGTDFFLMELLGSDVANAKEVFGGLWYAKDPNGMFWAIFGNDDVLADNAAAVEAWLRGQI